MNMCVRIIDFAFVTTVNRMDFDIVPNSVVFPVFLLFYSIRKAWIINWQNIINIPKCDLIYFSLCSRINNIKKYQEKVHNLFHGDADDLWKMWPANSTNMLSIGNINM